MVNEFTKARLVEIIYNAICRMERDEYEHGAILEGLGISELEYETIIMAVAV